MNKNNKNRCPDCRILLRKKFVTRADLLEVPQGQETTIPEPFTVIWTGEYYCPRCKIIVKEAK
jgi:hypothetical protein